MEQWIGIWPAPGTPCLVHQEARETAEKRQINNPFLWRLRLLSFLCLKQFVQKSRGGTSSSSTRMSSTRAGFLENSPRLVLDP